MKEQLLVASLFLVVRPGAPSRVLAPSSVLYQSIGHIKIPFHDGTAIHSPPKVKVVVKNSSHILQPNSDGLLISFRLKISYKILQDDQVRHEVFPRDKWVGSTSPGTQMRTWSATQNTIAIATYAITWLHL